ncbi:MAG: TetR/AcrR family transcriptional regulator [Christensenellaceae bacterium]|nr:TetR/AcrR family transcriptional regulator [Christensenellaceae bacterium]
MTLSIREIRQKEILDAATKVFIRQGFNNTSMEDIIAETSLSKGGFYYYYKNTVNILHDLMKQGMAYRMSKMNEFMTNYSSVMDKQALVEMLVDKMLDESELMSVYVIYLQAAKNNKELKALFPVLVEETLSLAYKDIKGSCIGDFKYYATDFMIFFMNTIILGCEILDARDNFKKNRDFFVEIVKLYFDYFDRGDIK